MSEKLMNFFKWLFSKGRIKMDWDGKGKYIRTTKKEVVKVFYEAGYKFKNNITAGDLK